MAVIGVIVMALLGVFVVNSAQAAPVTTIQRITIKEAAPTEPGALGTSFDNTLTVVVSANGKNTLTLGGFGPPKGAGNWHADDQLVLDITRPDGTVATLSKDFSDANCAALSPPLPPTDLNSFFQVGTNTVRARIINDCPTHTGSTTGLYLVYRNVTQ